MPSKEAIQILFPMVNHSNPPTEEEIQSYLDTLAENVPPSDVWTNIELFNIIGTGIKKVLLIEKKIRR